MRVKEERDRLGGREPHWNRENEFPVVEVKKKAGRFRAVNSAPVFARARLPQNT